MMAAKAAIIKDEIGIALSADPQFRSALGGQYRSFKANLLPALTPDEFADIYAETITYGMFAARFHDDDLSTFSRQEAMEDLPASNPFLKGLFEYIAGPALPKRLTYIVDDLVQVMRASDPHSLFRDFGKFTARNDPFVHFYEDFLAAYNPKKRKSRGVWYTPEPVVDFIVRAVDDVLKTEFGLADGLADTSKVTVDWDTGQDDPKTGKPRKIKKDVHKVQILDPATGTGTFLAKAVQLISDRVKARAPGKWSSYVEEDLLPRLHGFELLMASYAMCHMKLDMMLDQTGYKPSANPPRLSVWLTNALEPAEREVRDLFFQPLAEEARGASEVKRQTPIMCVIGNPPYSGLSQNMGDWITGLIEDYKYIDGKHFAERKHWLHDDYVKFIRMAEHVVGRNPSGGIVGLITNHGYLDNPTFRAMRWHLLRTFDKIYVLDLHGSAKKKEVSPDGSSDKNVFDIQQGVAIIIAVKRSPSASVGKRNQQPLAQVRRTECWGSRESKNQTLWMLDPPSDAWDELECRAPLYLLASANFELSEAYDAGFSMGELMRVRSKGIISARDDLAVDFDSEQLKSKIRRFVRTDLSDASARLEFFSRKSKAQDPKYPAGDSRGWKLPEARRALRSVPLDDRMLNIAYRPFDFRTIFNGPELVDWGRVEVTGHFSAGQNVGLAFNKRVEEIRPFTDALVFDAMIQHHSLSLKEANDIAPLYLYPDEGKRRVSGVLRTPNLDPKLYPTICKTAGIDPADQAVPEDDFRAATGEARPSEVKVFDYIYGVLHSPAYRDKFAEFLKIDFPRIPYPPSPEVFAHISEKGEQLRRLHLMEAAAIGETPYPYHGEGDDVVASGYPKWEPSPLAGEGGPQGRERGRAASAAQENSAGGGEDSLGAQTRAGPSPQPSPARGEGVLGRVHINKDQYFAKVPEVAWNFHIGGYQPAQKWLKDRRGRSLSWDDIGHYQKIVKILVETDRIMKEIELPL